MRRLSREPSTSRRDRASLRPAIALTLVCLGALAAPRSSFAWERVQQLVRGTAETLEKGQLTMGVFAPVTYGVTDALTVASHPIFDLLLLPNLDVRYRLYQGDVWVFAAYGGYEQGFLPGPTSTIAGASNLGAMATRYFGDLLSVSVGGGWSGRLDRRSAGSDSTVQDPGVAAMLNATLLLGQRHLLMFNGQLRYSFADGVDRPSVTGALVRAWDQFQLVGGLSLGDHTVHTLPIGSDPARKLSWPVMPYIDLWFDF
ncbi:MAG: hypothetical protein H6747_07700 [Deltaproteobacteria bacterium]|nr:hypothetical protein [Deltaproteobacteria bacterium]